MNKLRLHNTLLPLLGIVAVSMSSCSTDHDYDALTDKDGIDLTIQVGNDGVTIPIGSTSEIFLTELMDSAKTDILHISDDGNYSISESGTFNNTTIDIKRQQTVVAATIAPITQNVDKQAINAKLKEIREYIDIVYKDYDQPYRDKKYNEVLETTSIPYQINANIDETISDVFNFSAETDKSITSVKKITPIEPTEININIEISGLPSEVNKITLNPSVEFPDFFQIKEATGNILSLKDQIVNCVKGKGIWKFTAHLTGVDFEHSSLGSIKVNNGKINIENQFIRVKETVSSEELQLKLSSLAIMDGITATPTVSPISVNIDKVKGDFMKNDITPIEKNVSLNLSDDMDFLKGKDCSLDITNPIITVNVENGSEFNVNCNIECEGANKVSFPKVVIKPGANTIYLSRLALSGTENNYVNEKLSSIISYIPDNFKVKVTPSIDQKDVEVQLMDKIISGSYEIGMPLNFNSATIHYDKVIDDVLGDDPTDVTDLIKEVKGIELSTDATNAIPMGLTLELIARDKNGNDLPASEFTSIVDKTIEKGSIEAPITTHCVATITCSAIDKIKDIVIRVNGEGKGQLNSKQYIKLDNIKFKFKGQVIDLNDKD